MKIAVCSIFPWSISSLNRDLCSIHRGFVKSGINSKHVRPPSIDGTTVNGLIGASVEEMQTEKFWRSQSFDLVVANTWGSPKHNALVSAIKASGAKVLIRMDSDGFNSPWNGFAHYLFGTFYILRERSSPPVAAAKAFAKAFVYAIPQVYDQKMLAHLSLADAIGIESNGAYRLFSRLLRFYKREDLVQKLHVIRHPVVPEIDEMSVPPATERKNVIIGVGRWDSPQKDTPLLIATLHRVLEANPTWEAHLYGRGEDAIRALLRGLPASARRRLRILGPRPHGEILEAYQKAKICVFSSVYEGCPISGEEALCLGCSLVGPPDVPSMQDLCATEFGTLPTSRKTVAMAEAVKSEILLWEAGKRSPESIAAKARLVFSSQSVCRQILKVAGIKTCFD